MKQKNILLLLSLILFVMALPMKTWAKEEELSLQSVSEDQAKGNQFYLYEGNNNIKFNPYMKEPGIWEATIYAQPNDLGIYLAFTTATTVTASEIGLKNVEIYKKVLLGWERVGYLKKSSEKDTTIFAAETNYLNVEDGCEYKILATHYAIIDGVEHTVENEMTSIFWYEPVAGSL